MLKVIIKSVNRKYTMGYVCSITLTQYIINYT